MKVKETTNVNEPVSQKAVWTCVSEAFSVARFLWSFDVKTTWICLVCLCSVLTDGFINLSQGGK